jgi:GAF domain-containing protein/HAMP domain-containing protein
MIMNNPSNQTTSPQERRRINVLTISLITGVLFVIVSAISGYVGYSDNGIRGLFGFGITSLVAAASFTSAFLSHQGRSNLGITILISTIFALALTIPFVVHGQSLALGVMLAILVTGISSATLPPKWAARVILSAFAIAITITVIDLYLPDLGLPTNPATTNLIAAVASVFYIFFILRRFNSYALRTKIIIAFFLVTIIPLVALGVYNSRSSSQSLQSQSKSQLTTLAKIVADTVDSFNSTQLDAIRADSKQLALVSYLDLPVQSQANSIEENNARRVLLSLTRKNPVFIHSIAILDRNGINILDTFEENKGQNEGTQAYFKSPLQTGLSYASNVIFHNDDAFIYFSSPIIGREGAAIGVLRIEYYATVIQTIVRSIDPGSSGTIILLADSRTYIRVGYTGDRDELLKSFKNYNDLEFSVMQLENRLPPGSKENALKGLNDFIVAGIDNLQQQTFFEAYSNSLGSNTINTGLFLETQPWVAVVRQSTNVYLDPIATQNRTNILISMGLMLFSIGAGFFASQILSAPLISLAKVAETITAGDLTARAKASSEDEIGTLAISFNRMTEELYQTVNNLELRVSERTTALETARQQSEKRANELQAVSEISKIITSEQKLETLLPLITRLVSENFGFYHTGIFLIDETKQYAVLQAANSQGGKNMLARSHKLRVGETGIVGFVAKIGINRIALDVGQDAIYFNNPDMPNTRSEMALPLKVRAQIVGVLDVQSEQAGAFNEDNANTLSILADQIAIAIENARLFAQTQQALMEAQTLYRQNLQESWLSFSRDEASIGYQQNLSGGRKLTTPMETEEIRQTMNRGNSLVYQAGQSKQDPLIVVPIKLRGQVIGALNIKAPTQDRMWTIDEINLAEAISERLSLALENARLIQDSQRQLIKEQTISEVTGKIGTSINLKNVLQTAVEELGRAMPGSEVVINFEKNDK